MNVFPRRRVRPVRVNRNGKSTSLAVVIHGCTWTSRQRRTQLKDVVGVLSEALPDTDVVMPLLPIEFWSLENADDVVDDLVAEIDRVWGERRQTGGGYDRLYMVGFSFGSILLRQAFCRAAGAGRNATIDDTRIHEWARCVDRIVLLAGLNRGWTVDSPVSRFASIWSNIGTAIGHLLPRKPTLFAIRRGAPFLTLTRLQWLALEDAALKPPMTVQLLGTRDDIVSPADNLDLSTGSRFVYVEVPDSGHFDVIHMGDDSMAAKVRRDCFRKVLVRSPEELRAGGIPEKDLLQLVPLQGDPTGEIILRRPDSDVLDDVVFIIHGIRDKGYWTRKVARLVVTEGKRRDRRVAAVAPTYGYFALLPFLLPWTRRAKTEWLLDIYVSVRCRYPRAAVSFIGHSNGTYVLAGAIASCPAVVVKNVVFAGSVVRSNFDWTRYVPEQVGRVLNYVATGDWVVAIFPRLFQVLRLQDLGGAGHDGFANEPAAVTDIEYVAGRHSAALDEQHWQDMAAFVLDGPPPDRRVRKRDVWVQAAGHLAPLVWLTLLIISALPVYIFLTALEFPEIAGFAPLRGWDNRLALVPPWLWAGALLGWLRVLALVLTRL